MKYFALTVDNEVVRSVALPEVEDIDPDSQKPYLASDLEKNIAIYSSDPRVIPSEGIIPEGYIWDGQNFNPPVE